MKALIFGTILFDLFEDEVLIGGCSTNVASNCGKLGVETVHVSRVGDDRLGRLAIEHFKRIGVGTRHISLDPTHETGSVKVLIRDGGQPEYVLTDDVAYDYIELTDDEVTEIAAEGYDFLYYGTVDQRAPASAESLRKLVDRAGCPWIFCDINLRRGSFDRDNVRYSLESATILKLNEEEVGVVAGLLDIPYDADGEEACARTMMKAYDIAIVVVTKAESGAVAYTVDETIHRRGKQVDVVDGVGAGDAFSSAFMLTLIATGDIRQSLDAGNLLGGYVASKKGAVPDDADYPADLVRGKMKKNR